MAFVGLKDIIKIKEDRLRSLYKYYDTFVAAITNSKKNYLSLINDQEFKILYHFFSKISNMNTFIDIWRDLGFNCDPSAVYLELSSWTIRNNHKYQNVYISDYDENQDLKNFMQLMVFYWTNLSYLTKHENTNDNMGTIPQNIDPKSNIVSFFVLSLNKLIKAKL